MLDFKSLLKINMKAQKIKLLIQINRGILNNHVPKPNGPLGILILNTSQINPLSEIAMLSKK